MKAFVALNIVMGRKNVDPCRCTLMWIFICCHQRQIQEVTLHQVCFGISFDVVVVTCVCYYVIHIDILYIKSQMSLLLLLYFDF